MELIESLFLTSHLILAFLKTHFIIIFSFYQSKRVIYIYICYLIDFDAFFTYIYLQFIFLQKNFYFRSNKIYGIV